ncbi:MAG: hypothetical protein EHM72_11535 [Calditrichaeota bacterium]|nr:MAG: hypothetical protein EHM72_11535 [Calditrichota bacterium]
MELNCFQITIDETDFDHLINRYAPQSDRVSKLNLRIEGEHIVFSGSVKVLLSIPFEAVLKFDSNGRQIIAHLITLRPLRMLTEQLKEKILDKIVENMPPGAFREGEALIFDINALAQNRGFHTELLVTSLKTADDKISVTIQGTLSI